MLDEDDLERKHKRQHAGHSEARRTKKSNDCLTAVKNGQFVLLSGARASGKSTRLLWLEEKLESLDYKPAYFSFETIAYNGAVDRFWGSLGSAIQRSFRDETLSPIVNQETFLDAFRAEDWQQKIVDDSANCTLHPRTPEMTFFAHSETTQGHMRSKVSLRLEVSAF